MCRKRVYLVGCGKAKRDGYLPAKEKYSSNYFALKYDVADVFGDEVLILSALYGLLKPDRKIADYNVVVHVAGETDAVDLKDAGLETVWREKVRLQAERYDWADVTLVLLAGKAYLKVLRPVLEDLPCDVERYFAGTSGFGDQMGKMKRDLERGAVEAVDH